MIISGLTDLSRMNDEYAMILQVKFLSIIYLRNDYFTAHSEVKPSQMWR